MQDIKRSHDIIAYHIPRSLELTNAETHETERVVQAVISLTGRKEKEQHKIPQSEHNSI
jgi:hypothetical protein